MVFFVRCTLLDILFDLGSVGLRPDSMPVHFRFLSASQQVQPMILSFYKYSRR